MTIIVKNVTQLLIRLYFTAEPQCYWQGIKKKAQSKTFEWVDDNWTYNWKIDGFHWYPYDSATDVYSYDVCACIGQFWGTNVETQTWYCEHNAGYICQG